jgi:tRNA modification GTPase
MRQDIIQCLAMVEALIDFGEGEDIEDGVFAQGLYDLDSAHVLCS